jgi:hypothetical protein
VFENSFSHHDTLANVVLALNHERPCIAEFSALDQRYIELLIQTPRFVKIEGNFVTIPELDLDKLY